MSLNDRSKPGFEKSRNKIKIKKKGKFLGYLCVPDLCESVYFGVYPLEIHLYEILMLISVISGQV